MTVDDAVAGEKLTGTVTLFGPPPPNGARGAVYSAGPAPIETGSDGVTRAIIDRIVETPGELTATLRVCRGEGVLAGLVPGHRAGGEHRAHRDGGHRGRRRSHLARQAC